VRIGLTVTNVATVPSVLPVMTSCSSAWHERPAVGTGRSMRFWEVLRYADVVTEFRASSSGSGVVTIMKPAPPQGSLPHGSSGLDSLLAHLGGRDETESTCSSLYGGQLAQANSKQTEALRAQGFSVHENRSFSKRRHLDSASTEHGPFLCIAACATSDCAACTMLRARLAVGHL
jgi:hypothetical protein